MKKLLILVLLLQGALMATSLNQITIKNTQVPVVFEEGKYIPIVSLQLVFKNAGHLSNTIDGLADISAKLLNEGTAKEGSVGFATKLDAHAVDIAAHVGRESLVIEISALKSEIAYAVERLIELLKDPNYTKEALDQIKYQKIGWITQKRVILIMLQPLPYVQHFLKVLYLPDLMMVRSKVLKVLTWKILNILLLRTWDTTMSLVL